MMEPELTLTSLEASRKRARDRIDEQRNAEVRDRDLCRCSVPRPEAGTYFGQRACLLCRGWII